MKDAPIITRFCHECQTSTNHEVVTRTINFRSGLVHIDVECRVCKRFTIHLKESECSALTP